MMNKKMMLILLSLMMIFAFCGCRLAVEDKGTVTNTDALCGMFITFEPLYSEEDYLDNIDWGAVMNGGTALYQTENKPIYATEKRGEYGDLNYVFEGIEGIPLFEMVITWDGEGYWTSCSDHEQLDIKESCGGSPAGNDLKLEGTLYVYITEDFYDEYGDCKYFCNPVYQTSDGQVYVVPGSGYSIVTNSDTENDDGWKPYNQTIGNLGTATLSGNKTLTIDNEEQSWTAEIKLTVVGINEINKYILKEMDAQDNVISVTEITKDSIPDEVRLKDNTAYAFLEEHSTDVSGNAVIERSIVDLNMQSLEVRFPNEKGFAKGHEILLKNINDNSEVEND